MPICKAHYDAAQGLASNALLHLESSRVENVSPAVLTPSCFVVAMCERLFFAVADGLQLGFTHAKSVQRLLHHFGATLAERQVVLADLATN